MYDDIDNDRDFWQDEPTRRLSRLPQRVVSPRYDGSHRPRARQHVSVITTPRRERRSLDPFLVRLGLIACVGVALLPLAYTMRHGAGEVLRTAPTGGAAALPLADRSSTSTVVPTVAGDDVAAADVVEMAAVEPVGSEAPSTSANATTTTVFDIDALPPAVPVNDVGTEAPATTATSAPAAQKAAATTAPPATHASTTAPAKTESPTAAVACSKSYEVAPGDYWILIADKAGVALKDLLAANGATVQTPLYPGRDICLPKGASTPATPTATTTPRTTTNTTKPTSTTAAPTTTTIPRRTYTAAEVEAIIRAVWPDDLEDEAIRIARRESNLQPTAHNACCYGLFQIYFNVHKGWLAAMGITSAQQLMDPEIGARAAYALYQRNGGWGPWAI